MNKSFVLIALATLTMTPAFAAVSEQISTVPANVVGQQLSAPQAFFESKKLAVVERFVSNAPTAHIIDVGPLKAEDGLKSATSKRGDFEKRTALQIGFPREIPVALRTLPLAALPWQKQADGSQALKVEVLASEAAGIRVGYRFEGPVAGAQLRFAGSANPEVFKVDAAKNSELHWSPTMEGDRGTIEMRVLPGFESSAFKLTIEQLSHLKIVGAGLSKTKARDPAFCRDSPLDIGCSESCNIDVACVTNPSQGLLDIARATAKIIYTDGGSTFLCTGTLLNSNPRTNRPYFFTAAHCIDNQPSASSLESYWFLDAVACGSKATPLFQRVTGGAALLVADIAMDVTLLQLNDEPPTGAVLAGWDATVIPTNAAVVGMHHPSGDLKAYSQGLMQGYGRGPQFCDEARTQTCSTYLRDSYIRVRWEQGTTEQGSSGSGVFTFDQNSGTYSLRGGLEGGAASCSNTAGVDRYSRMDLLFTKLAPYLQPSGIIPASNAVTSTMIEYYNPEFNFYFMTSREAEKALLNATRDVNQNLLWYPTGNAFKTDSSATPGTSSIVRYFNSRSSNQGRRGMHFYTATNEDKQYISASGLERFPSQGCPDRFLCNEGIDSYVTAPTNYGLNGTCPAGLKPIYRSFRRNVDDGTHRFLPSAGMYQYVLSGSGMGETWDPEGVAFCARP
jgi:lysyl endopeptidase